MLDICSNSAHLCLQSATVCLRSCRTRANSINRYSGSYSTYVFRGYLFSFYLSRRFKRGFDFRFAFSDQRVNQNCACACLFELVGVSCLHCCRCLFCCLLSLLLSMLILALPSSLLLFLTCDCYRYSSPVVVIVAVIGIGSVNVPRPLCLENLPSAVKKRKCFCVVQFSLISFNDLNLCLGLTGC